MGAFDQALCSVLDLTYNALRKEQVQWTLVGSAATLLQGVQLTPADIDLLMRHPRGVFSFARLMAPHSALQNRAEVGSEDWLSTPEVPVVADEPEPDTTTWHFGRWLVEGFRVEAAHIKPPSGYVQRRDPEGGIWEAGPQIWPHIITVPYRSYNVPVVPLEIQLQTNMTRHLPDRVQGIGQVLRRRGCDRHLLRIALSEEHIKRLSGHLPCLEDER